MKSKIISLLIVIAYLSTSFILFSGDGKNLSHNPDTLLNKFLGFPYFLSQGVGFYLGIAGLILTIIILGSLLWYIIFHILNYFSKGK